MRPAAVIACIIVALDCASKATGETPSKLFNPDYLWTWWIIAAGWAAYALIIAFRGAR